VVVDEGIFPHLKMLLQPTSYYLNEYPFSAKEIFLRKVVKIEFLASKFNILMKIFKKNLYVTINEH